MNRLFLALRSGGIAAVVTALSALSVCASAQTPADTIEEREVRAHIDFLADDLLEGRDSGYRGAEISALYIETQLRNAGLRPWLDTWQMPVEIRGAAGVGLATVTMDGLSRSEPAMVEPLSASPAGRVVGKLVTGDEDPSGNILLLPGGDDLDAAEQQAATAIARGAAGVILIAATDEFRRRARPDMRRRPTRGGDGGGGGYLAAETVVAARRTLAAPTVRVNRFVGTDLILAADEGEQAEIEVTRDGRDETTNVLGWVEGSDPALKDELVIIGAHYDHVGHDELGNIWNGADDNASGTAAVLEIAEALGAMPTAPRRSILLALWGAEERGLFGSRAFVDQEKAPIDKVAAYLNLDMISRNQPDHVSALHTSESLFGHAEAAAKRHGMSVDNGVSFFLQSSDTEPFVKRQVPTLFFFTGLHSDYHRPSDDPPTADADKATRIARATLDVALAVANSDARPDFEEPATGGARRGPSRRLGVYPGAAKADEEGIRVESVSPSSLAATAGIQPGDRIIRVAGMKINAVTDLRAALREPKAGEKFAIDLLRSDAEGETPVTVYGEFDA